MMGVVMARPEQMLGGGQTGEALDSLDPRTKPKLVVEVVCEVEEIAAFEVSEENQSVEGFLPMDC
jgi:hypothetical protein